MSHPFVTHMPNCLSDAPMLEPKTLSCHAHSSIFTTEAVSLASFSALASRITWSPWPGLSVSAFTAASLAAVLLTAASFFASFASEGAGGRNRPLG